MIRSIRWQAPVTELWFGREAPLSALGLSLLDIGHMVHFSDDLTDISLSLLAGGRQGLPMPSVEEALTTLGYVRPPGDTDPWWIPPDPLPQSLPRTLMEQPFAATYADTLVFASQRAASQLVMAGDAPSLADDPHFAAAAAAGRAPILQAMVLTSAVFADPYASQEDIADDQLPAFRMVLFTRASAGQPGGKRDDPGVR